MKYLTLDVYRSWYGTNYEDGSIMNAAFMNYWRHLDELQDVLPPNLLTLARMRGVDDALVVKVEHDRSQRVLTLTLRCGDLQMGYYDLILTYQEAAISAHDECILGRIARTTKDDRRHESDLLCYELDKTEEGFIEHRLLFHPGVWFAIQCRELRWKKVDRPNQKLPILKDRFPGAPLLPT